MENPQYVLFQDMKRVMITEAVKVALLCILFYFAISLNVNLAYKYLIWDIQMIGNTRLLVIAIIIVLYLIELLLIYKKSRNPYNFYKDRIEFKKGRKTKVVYYRDMTPKIKQNIIDQVFKTASILLFDKSKLKNIKNYNQILLYIQQMVRANRWSKSGTM